MVQRRLIEEEGLQRSPLTPRRIYERLCEYVIGQDAAKRTVALAAYNHLKRIRARGARGHTLLQKSNILLVGPTGSGKTHLARQLARILEVPFVVVDATEYTEAGYYGKDVEAMVAELLSRAEQSVDASERGIVFIDEIDKIARKAQSAKNGAGARDIGGEGVQQSLLKLLEGREVQAPSGTGGGHWSRQETATLSTRDILFICAGTFSDLHEEEAAALRRAPVGFGAAERKREPEPVTVKKLVEYGMMAELLGRLPVMVQLGALTDEELVRILVEPPDALAREYGELLSMDGIALRFAPEGLRRMARYALERGVGARGLRAVMEHVMAELMFDAPERGPGTVEITEDFVERRLRVAELAV